MAAYGPAEVDGVLAPSEDWSSHRLDTPASGVAGWALYGRYAADTFVFALEAPAGQTIGAGTTFWIDADLNRATGYQIFGFAGGAEVNINIAADGVPRLYAGGAGQTLLSEPLDFAFSADRRLLEIAVPAARLPGAPRAINVLVDVNDQVFLPTSYTNFTYTAAAPAAARTIGDVVVDGALGEWSAAQRIDAAAPVAGWAVHGRITGDHVVFALQAPAGATIGAQTTLWLNTDRNAATGHQIWGFAGGAEFNIDFAGAGLARLYTGDAGQILVAADLPAAISADGRALEVAVPLAAIGAPTSLSTLIDVNNATFLPGNFSGPQYVVAPAAAPVVGAVTLDGALGDWTQAERIDAAAPVAGWEVYGRVTGGHLTFAIAAPAGQTIGTNTTIWLNTDLNAATGHQIFGLVGGAEFNLTFIAPDRAMLYSGASGQTLVSAEVQVARSADGRVVEIAAPSALIGAPAIVGALIDVNDAVFLPNDYSGPQYLVVDPGAAPPRLDAGKKVAILYSETSAETFFSKTAYSQLIMTAQSQAQMAGLPFDLITEADLKNVATLAQYDALVMPSFRNVKAADVPAIEAALQIAVRAYGLDLIAAGDVMTNDETGAALAGDPYARMEALFDLTRVGGGARDVVTVSAGAHEVAEGFTPGQTIRTYAGFDGLGVGWSVFADATPGTSALSVAATQTVAGVGYAAVQVGAANGARQVHFSTEGQLADNNLLSEALEYVVYGDGPSVALRLSRDPAIMASRNDMDQSQFRYDVAPDAGAGIYDVMLPILERWKAQYDFVGSYYINVGVYPEALEATVWGDSRPAYAKILALGNEIGTHSYSHPADTNLLLPDVVSPERLAEVIAGYQRQLGPNAVCFCPYCVRSDADPIVVEQLGAMSAAEVTQRLGQARAAVEAGRDPGTLDPIAKAILEASFNFQFARSKHVIDANLGINVTGAAVPGAPETLETSLEIIKYFEYMSGGFSGFGAGYPGAFGYLTPGVQDKVYIAPNISFDFSLVQFRQMTPEQALAAWLDEVGALTRGAALPVLVWPWHDYGPTEWVIDPPSASPYTLEMFDDFLAAMAAMGTEFVTLDDLARRISAQEKAVVDVEIAGDRITATVNSTDAGRFALDLGDLGGRVIQSVSGWYAYDADSVFLPRAGGTFAITLGATAADVTRIVKLPARAELVTLSGNGQNLTATIVGEGELVVDLKSVPGAVLTVSGAEIVARAGDIVTLALGRSLAVDGGFELPGTPAWSGARTSGAALYGVAAAEGQRFIELDAAPGADRLAQTITTAAGAAYELSFALHARPGAALATNTVEVWLGGVRIATFDPAAAAGWSRVAVTFYGAGGPQLLELREAAGDDDGQGALIDALRILALAPAEHAVSVTLAADPTPVITSAGGGASANLNAAENGLAVTTVQAVSPVGAAIAYGIAGGADAARFAINPTTGVLTFRTAPDFEAPADAGLNNVYDVIVEARAGALADLQALAVTVTNVLGVTRTITNGAPTSGTNEEDTLTGSGAADRLTGLGGADRLVGQGGADTLDGGLGADTLVGGTGNDTLLGGDGADRLEGDAGNDRLEGGAGADLLIGGANADTLLGGPGPDTFAFGVASHSSATARDQILDFLPGEDRIDLSALDARTATGANDAFVFAGLVAGPNVPTGSVGFYYETVSGQTRTILTANVNNSTAPELQIAFTGQLILTANDFFL